MGLRALQNPFLMLTPEAVWRIWSLLKLKILLAFSRGKQNASFHFHAKIKTWDQVTVFLLLRNIQIAREIGRKKKKETKRERERENRERERTERERLKESRKSIHFVYYVDHTKYIFFSF